MADGTPIAAPCCGSAVAPGVTGEGRRVELMVPGVRCAGCIARVEKGLRALPGVTGARVNLSMKRLAVTFDPATTGEAQVIEALDRLGYPGRPFDAAALKALDRDAEGQALLARLGVAGFAAMNVMLLSVSVWSGAEGATRDLLHWVSALIALPATAFAGMPFYTSAIHALATRRLNMDVPISLAVWLAVGVSLYETAQSGPHAYFDASITLIFFLLIGRYLDHRSRRAARSAAAELVALRARSVVRLGTEGREVVTPEDLGPGDRIEIAAGERVAADGVIEAGLSDIDRALVTGESVPQAMGPGETLHAGMLNLSGPITLRVTATGDRTLLADIARMIEAAETADSRTRRLAERAAAVYAPGVHIIAALAFAAWLWSTGDLRASVMTAAAVLIITCPCALGLAIPAVQAVAGGRLFRRGIFLKDGGALERLAKADTVVFDKTGTLTTGQPTLTGGPEDDAAWALARALAEASRHPLARAVAAEAGRRGIAPAPVEAIAEVPGCGVEGRHEGRAVRLGRADWCGAAATPGRSSVTLSTAPGQPFLFEDPLKEDAADTVAALKARGLDVLLLSGDAEGPVARAAAAAGIGTWEAGITPATKLARIGALTAEGRTVLMVGDGLNDAPALAAADVSMSPAAAADVAQAAASLVFTGERLAPVLEAHDVARAARGRMLENLGLAAIYNAIAIPLAVAGLVTPVIAAVAMSASSVLVTLNALRLRGRA